jgi:hypothetical protein
MLQTSLRAFTPLPPPKIYNLCLYSTAVWALRASGTGVEVVFGVVGTDDRVADGPDCGEDVALLFPPPVEDGNGRLMLDGVEVEDPSAPFCPFVESADYPEIR